MPKRPVQPDDLLRLVFVSEPQMSPDGSQVLFTKKWIEKNKYRTQLVSASLNGDLKEWTRVDLGASHGRWSPDGSQIAFISTRENEKSQIYVLNTKGGEAKALTNLPEGDFGDFCWSTDGSKIAFSHRERHPDFTKEAAKKREEKGLSDPPRIANTPNYRLDGEGYFLDQRHALYVVELETRNTKKLYDKCPWGRYSFDWSPDSTRLAVKRSFQKNLWKDPEDDRVLFIELSGKAKELKGQPGGYKSAVRWSPDGKLIAFIGNPDPLDHRCVANSELFVLSVAGGKLRRLTKDTDYDLETNTLSDTVDVGGEYLEWLPDSSGLLISIGWHGEGQLARVTLDGKLEFLTKGPQLVTPGTPSRNGKRIACILGDPTHPAEVAVFEKGRVKKLTSFNRAFLDEVELAEPREFRTKASDGYPVHGWVLQPKGGKGKKPAVLEIHGGPQCQYGDTYFHEFQVLVGAGYVVVYTNPRGSKGYGADHCRAIAGHWGNKDWLDVEAAKDWMKAQPFVDSKRMGVMGGSYGGYMTNWVVGHTDDFRAAITDRCVSNLLSKSLSSDYPYYPGTHWIGGGYSPLEKNADLWRDTPLAYFDRVKTPMLIIHSEGDLRCEIEQGEQVFSALQERGIPSRFVRYPTTTSHGMSRGGPPDLRLHRLDELLRWWKRWLI